MTNETFIERHAGHICGLLIAALAAAYGLTAGAAYLHALNHVAVVVAR